MKNRLAKVISEFCKFLYERNQGAIVDAIHAADKFQIVESGEVGLKSASKRQRPGDLHPSQNSSRGGTFSTADHANQSGFAGTVATQNAQMGASFEPKAYVA